MPPNKLKLLKCCDRPNIVEAEDNGRETGELAGDGEGLRPQLRPLLKRYWPMLVLSWCMELSLGAAISMPGPTLPYLALKVSEPIDRLGFMFTGSSITSCVTAWLTGLVLAGLTDSSRVKLIGLLLGNGLLVAALIATPSADSLAGIIAAQCTTGAGVAVISTVDNMLVIYLFGPVLSRSLSHSLHFCVGVGGFLAPLLARPFLISMGDVDGGDVCGGGGGGTICPGRNGSSLAPDDNTTSVWSVSHANLQPLTWPFIIIACLHGFCLCGYALLLLVNFQLKRYQGSSSDLATKSDLETTPTVNSTNYEVSSRQKWTIVILFVVFYVLHAGQESGFWSYLYSFGVCSRLCFSPDQASLLNTIFFIGYLISRGSGVLVSRLVQPSILLLGQLTGCLIATSLLAAWGDTKSEIAYIGAALYGLCIAMVFPTGITWLAERLDVTGALSSTWSIGTYIGASTYPLATGYLIGAAPVGAAGMMYLAAAASAAYLIVACCMMLAARGLKKRH